MTAETAPQPERQVHPQGAYQQIVTYGIVLAAVVHIVLHDRRFQVAVITGAIGTYALASVIKNNEARPVRRAFHWYAKFGASKRLARRHRQARQELARAGQAIGAGTGS
jgi:hypothetical protein